MFETTIAGSLPKPFWLAETDKLWPAWKATGAELEKAKREGRDPSPETKASMESMRADYEQQLDARFAAARGFVDAIITPEETRDFLAFTLRITANYAGPHLGPFVLPQLDAATLR